MVVWPENRGPLAGKCPECKVGTLVLWYGDRIYRVYKCLNCGMIHEKRGVEVKVGNSDVRKIVDKVFTELGLSVVDKRAFMVVVDRVCYDELKGRIPAITRAEFKSWGYDVTDSQISRRKGP